MAWKCWLPVEQIVPAEILLLFSAGALIPADCRLLEARDLFVNEAMLTGETFPVEKTPEAQSSPTTTALALRTNSLLHGDTCR